jgi:hypothetical protein
MHSVSLIAKIVKFTHSAPIDLRSSKKQRRLVRKDVSVSTVEYVLLPRN